MKIIQLNYMLGAGGAEKFLVDLSNTLAVMGHDVEVCMLLTDENHKWSFNKSRLSAAVKFHSMGFKKEGFNLKKVFEVSKYIRKQNPDIVHCHLNILPYIYPLLGTRIKFIHTIHSVANRAAGIGIQKYIDRLLYKMHIVTPVTISKECQLSFKQFHNIANVKQIDNGTCPVSKSPLFDSVQEEIDELKNTSRTKVFIHVARCNRVKRQEVLIDAFNKLDALGKDFVLLVIGGGFDSEYGIQLQEKACKKIHFLGIKQNVGDYLLNSDAFCLTSECEGLPISLIEAMSAGLTPICTPAGGILDVIRHKQTGYVSDGFNCDNYLKALHLYYEHPIDKAMIAQAFEKSYTMSICANKYIELYEE